MQNGRHDVINFEMSKSGKKTLQTSFRLYVENFIKINSSVWAALLPHIHTHRQTDRQTNTDTHTQTKTYTHTHIYTPSHTYIHTYIHTNTSTYRVALQL